MKRFPKNLLTVLLVVGSLDVAWSVPVRAANKGQNPNVVMFSMDDLNCWINPMGYSQAKTPNLDRLAKAGVTFMDAHAPGVFCAPSRTAIWTGLQAFTTGCYQNEVFRYDYPDMVTLQTAFKQGGYNTYGAGKLYHHRGGYVDLRDWDEYFSRSQEMRDTGWEMNGYHMNDVPLPDPYPYSPYFEKYGNKKNSSAGHMEWGPIANDQEDKMVDTMRTDWMCEVLKRKHDKPFFAALGFTPRIIRTMHLKNILNSMTVIKLKSRTIKRMIWTTCL